MLSTIYILLTALGDDEGYLPRVYREAISCFGTFRTSSDVRSMVAIRAKADIERLDPEMVAAQAKVEVRAEPIAFFQRNSSKFVRSRCFIWCNSVATRGIFRDLCNSCCLAAFFANILLTLPLWSKLR